MDIDKILANLSEEELEKFSQGIQNKKEYLVESRIKETIEQHKAYIGKCYKKRISFGLNQIDGFRYIKLIRAESENEFWMEALIFENPVYYNFRKKSHMMYHPGDYVFGSIEYDGIRVEEIGWFTLGGKNGYQEITQKEFNEAMDQHIAELKAIDWRL